MNVPSTSDRVVKVRAYLTDEAFGYDHWRAAQFVAPAHDKFGVLLLFDTEADRDAAFRAALTPPARPPDHTEQEPALTTYMLTDDGPTRDAAFLRTYAVRVLDGTAISWEIPNTVASTLNGIADRIQARAAVAPSEQ